MEERQVILTPADVALPNAYYEAQITLSPDAFEVPYLRLGQLALWAMGELKIDQPAELSLSFVGTALMRVLNRDFRNIDKATDVLSFGSGWDEQELALQPDQPLVLGDIVICPEIADKVSYGEDMSFLEKLEVLVIHGILHLLGHDHESQSDADNMDAVSDHLLTAWSMAADSLTAALTAIAPQAVTDQASTDDGSPLSGRHRLSGEDQATADRTDMATEKQPSSLIQAFRWAIEGILATVKTQRNMQIHLVVAAVAIIAGVIFSLGIAEWAIIIICIALVLVAEMLNTAIEQIVDLASPDIHPKAKLAKDIGAGIVLIAALAAVAAGLFVYVDAVVQFVAGL
ncbi:MAG: rRNA maturation RNase YbeY [Coriobacteriales bacterium]|jgi:rRNA maturation RNase YbeY|nr:rRNA maturation RNase YbeY [Coriobacteriales bacterium]